MKMLLIRYEFSESGIFGDLFDESGERIAATAEHAYQSPSGDFIPKVPPGEYSCRKGFHQLSHMPAPQGLFEICDVPGHSDILFHVGNYPQIDSEGCVLLGTEEVEMNGKKIITGSRAAFTRFMQIQGDVEEFTLTVE